MGRLCHVEDLLDVLKGVGLDALTNTGSGELAAERNRLLEQEIAEAESWAEMLCQRTFTPLARHTEILSGQGSTEIQLEHRPVFDVLQIQVRYDPLSTAHTFGSDALRVQKETGLVGIRPNFALQGAWPMGMGSAYQYLFARGINNIVVQYRSGYGVIGDNLGLSRLADESFPHVAAITTDANYAYFTLPESYALFKYGRDLSERAPNVMLQDGSDVSASWTMTSNRQLRAAIGSYTSTATYVFVYVPAAVGQAVAEYAASLVLAHKGMRDGNGVAGGVTKWQAQGFTEEYGEMQYAGHVKDLRAHAKQLLGSYRRLCIA